ncbi:hypothetical protein PWT90_07692 [Aphanocladium album]|nr:hypothetical protein PWT90_07692 [Aphanocladium album]
MNPHFNSLGGMQLSPGPVGMYAPRPGHNINIGNLLLALQGLNIGQNFVYESEYKGSRFVLFKFRREDGSHIALRIQHQWPIPIRPDILQNVVRREVYALKKLELIQFRFAPKCLAFDLGFNNPLQHPFLVVTWTDGQPAIWNHEHPTMEQRERFLNQLFDLHEELIDTSLETKEETAKQFYTRIIHDKMMSAPRGPPGAGGMPTQEDCWNQLSYLDSVLGVARDENTYAVAHNNLTPDNIIVDDNYNIECIIGWSFGGVYPLCQAAILPRFLAPPINFSNAVQAHFLSQKLTGDRMRYRHPLNLYNITLTPAKAAMRMWLNGDDADFRVLYMLSIKHRDIHAWLARHHWSPPHCQKFRDTQ